MERLQYFKSKKILAAGALVVVLLIIGVVFLVNKHKSQESVQQIPVDQSMQFPTLTVQDIGMVVTVRPDKKAVKFEVKKYQDIEKIEYTITYNKKEDGEVVPEGILGEMNIAKDGITVTDYRDFGTCSSGVCHYDDVVSNPIIILNVTKKDGKTYEVKYTVKL